MGVDLALILIPPSPSQLRPKTKIIVSPWKKGFLISTKALSMNGNNFLLLFLHIDRPWFIIFLDTISVFDLATRRFSPFSVALNIVSDLARRYTLLEAEL